MIKDKKKDCGTINNVNTIVNLKTLNNINKVIHI